MTMAADTGNVPARTLFLLAWQFLRHNDIWLHERECLPSVASSGEPARNACMDQLETQIATESQLDAAALQMAALPDPPVSNLN